MKTSLRRLLAATALLGLFTGPAFAAGNTDTLSVNASATLQQPLALTEVTALDFSNVVIQSGDVSLLANGTATYLPATMEGPAASPSAAVVSVTGEANLTYDITLPASADIGAGASAQTITAFFLSSSDGDFTPGLGGGTVGTGTLDGSGDDTLSIGGNLNVDEGTAISGLAAGTFDVIVAYN